MPGTVVVIGTKHWTVGAVTVLSGERYYMLVDPRDSKSVALMPASEVEV